MYSGCDILNVISSLHLFPGGSTAKQSNLHTESFPGGPHQQWPPQKKKYWHTNKNHQSDATTYDGSRQIEKTRQASTRVYQTVQSGLSQKEVEKAEEEVDRLVA